MAHLHFTSCEAHRRRVIQLGENPESVFNVGALGVENIRKLALLDETAIRKELELSDDRPYFVCTFHPVTLENDSALEQIATLCRALEQFPDYAVIFTGANADAGGMAVNEFLRKYAATHTRHRFFMSLGQLRYFSAMKYAACGIGNSSRAIIEAPSLGVPVIDMGDRQKGRERAKTVRHCPAEHKALTRTIKNSLHARPNMNQANNPYEQNNTATTIAELLLDYPARNTVKKVFHDLPRQAHAC
jgi:UDP-hydrolysing UDP-N-acetyl-D-glucosamine 2-epimerase